MFSPSFSVTQLGDGQYTINDGGRTVALISSQGYVDWLLTSPSQPGPLLTRIEKETHLCYTLGFKFMLVTPTPATELQHFSYHLEDHDTRLVLEGTGKSMDGAFTSFTTAELSLDAGSGRYRWSLDTTITCTAPVATPIRTLEYNNVYPARTGCCMLFTPQKEYSCTLMTDADGVIWRFPHQHQLHYSRKINQLPFADGSIAGFFGEPAPHGYPVVEVVSSTLPPNWAICDMYYDLHCMALPPGSAEPGDSYRFRYLIKYLDPLEAERMLQMSRPAPITLDDWDAYDMPRFELGMNSFTRGIDIDRPDDASAFRVNPPKMVWDREVGHRTRGSLRITNTMPEETVWSSVPPTQIPADTRLNITAMVKTENVLGTGVYIRVRYHTFVWHPTPHVEWVTTLTSTPVNGSSEGWVQVSVPELRVPPEHFDYLVWIDLVLDGSGVAWLTDIDVDLQYEQLEPPALEEGGSQQKAAIRSRARSGAGSLG